jgi:hypothetical protein
MIKSTAPERIVLFGFEDYEIAPAAPTSDVHARVASVARLIAREAWRAVSSLTPRRRAQFDVDDLAQEAWAILLTRDHEYDPTRYAPEKGGYVGFARLTLRRHFAKTLLRVYAVHVPRKFSEPSSGIRDDPAALAAYRRGTKDPRPLRPGSAAVRGESVAEEAERREAACLAREATRRALDGMADRRHAAILRRHYGLLGEPLRPVRGILFRALRRAEDEAREILGGSAVAV